MGKADARNVGSCEVQLLGTNADFGLRCYDNDERLTVCCTGVGRFLGYFEGWYWKKPIIFLAYKAQSESYQFKHVLLRPFQSWNIDTKPRQVSYRLSGSLFSKQHCPSNHEIVMIKQKVARGLDENKTY